MYSADERRGLKLADWLADWLRAFLPRDHEAPVWPFVAVRWFASPEGVQKDPGGGTKRFIDAPNEIEGVVQSKVSFFGCSLLILHTY